MNPFLGQIQQFGFNFAPRNWAFCAGQILPIAQNTALFSLLGTMYGGDGRTTFALPDLRGHASFQFGRGPGLSDYRQGSPGGTEKVGLTLSQLPDHNHTANVSAELPNAPKASGALLATPAPTIYSDHATPDATLNSITIGQAGGNQPHNNMQPYLVVNWCIALQGVYPPRS